MTPMTRRIAVRPPLLALQWPVSPGRAGVRRQRTAEPWCLTIAGEVMSLPRGELQRAGDHDDHADRERYGER